MKIFNCKKHGIGRNHIKSAASFKKMAQRSGMDGLDFSVEALYEHYYYSTYGKASYLEKYGRHEPDRRKNAYSYGEFLYNITTAAIEEDLARGDVCKAEFVYDMSSTSMVRRFVKNIDTVGRFFLMEAEANKRENCQNHNL